MDTKNIDEALSTLTDSPYCDLSDTFRIDLEYVHTLQDVGLKPEPNYYGPFDGAEYLEYNLGGSQAATFISKNDPENRKEYFK